MIGKGMTVDTKPQVPEAVESILERIDAIIAQLQALRRAILEDSKTTQENLTHQLYGALGQGNWEEYDPKLDWQRFAPSGRKAQTRETRRTK